MGDLAILDQEPPKVFLVNLETNERWDAMFNPTTLEESLEVKFNRLSIQGLSHERLQYTNTGNKTVPLEFFLSQTYIDQRFGANTFDIFEDKAFLESLGYPAADIDFSYQGTPRVLFVWPGVLRMVGRIVGEISFLNRTFNTNDGKVTVLVANLDFEEDRDFRILMDEVREHGGQRYRQQHESENVEEGGG